MKDDKKARALVVDDELQQREMIRETLVLSDFEVDTATNLEEAQKFLEAKSYDVLVTDIALGEESGLELARFAKALDNTIEVIAITGYATVETVLEAMKIGAFSYMLKPLDLPELKNVVQRAVARSKAAKRSKKALEELAELGKIVPLPARPKLLSYGKARISRLDPLVRRATRLDRIRSKLRSLKILWELKRFGAITEEEYETLKKEILNESS